MAVLWIQCRIILAVSKKWEKYSNGAATKNIACMMMVIVQSIYFKSKGSKVIMLVWIEQTWISRSQYLLNATSDEKNNGIIEIIKRHDWPRPLSLNTCNFPIKNSAIKHMLTNETGTIMENSSNCESKKIKCKLLTWRMTTWKTFTAISNRFRVTSAAFHISLSSAIGITTPEKVRPWSP